MKLIKNEKMPDFVYSSPYSQEEKHFSQFANGKKTYVVFLRYFGCTVCRLDLHVYAQRIKEFEDKNAQLMVVLQSEPSLVKGEAPEGVFPFEIACDPSQQVYKQFEIMPAKNKLSLVGSGVFKALKKMKAAKAFGFTHGEFEGDEQQLPAMALVDENGILQFVHYAKNLADMPSVDEMIEKL
ncbi:MAG: redoxin domain-containing protein [Oscillospiraceae bacterium]